MPQERTITFAELAEELGIGTSTVQRRIAAEARFQESTLHDWAALIAIEEAQPKPGSLMLVTPTMRSWNQFSAFIEEWDGLRTLGS